MSDVLFEYLLLGAVERARKDAQVKMQYGSHKIPEEVLRNSLEDQFSILNFQYKHSKNNGIFTFPNEIKLDKVYDSNLDKFGKTKVGIPLIALGAPLLKKRFVTPGSASGTSIASKYLAKAIPYRLPFRVLSTNVLGRAIGRAVPYLGWALIAIDVIEYVMEEHSEQKVNGKFGGFRGGRFGGGGNSSKW